MKSIHEHICEKYLWQLFVISILYQLLHQLFAFVSNLDFKQHWLRVCFNSWVSISLSHISPLIYSRFVIVSLVHIFKCTFQFLALLNNSMKSNVKYYNNQVCCVVPIGSDYSTNTVPIPWHSIYIFFLDNQEHYKWK